MADDIDTTNGAGGGGEGSGDSTNSGTTTQQATNEPSAAELAAQLAQARQEAAAAQREKEGTQAYLQNLLNTLNVAAASRGNTEGAEQARSLAEKLAENPELALDEHFRSRMGPIYNTYLQNAEMTNRELARERLSRDENLKDADGKSFWDKYEKEVDDFMKSMPPEVKARPGAYERALKFVMADHLDEVTEARAARISKQREARERGAFVEGPGGAAPKSRSPEGLTQLEKEVAKGLGMSEAQFLEAKKVDQFGNTGT